MNNKEFIKMIFCGMRCSLIGHKIEEIYLEDEEWCKANPDKDLEVKCRYCGDTARLYWSKKKKQLKVYQPNIISGPTGALFGDIGRDGIDIYGENYLPPLYKYNQEYELIE